MKATDALHQLLGLGRPVIETAEVVTRLHMTSANAGWLLRSLEKDGHVRRIAQGVWLIDHEADPAVAVPYLTRPFPGYVSLWSGLYRHGMIEQIPRRIFAISLARTRTVETPIGAYSIHRIAPQVFGGYTGDDLAGFFATPEKALFDSIYLPSAQRQTAYFPELELPEGFQPALLDYWVERIGARWLRVRVERAIEQALAVAVQA